MGVHFGITIEPAKFFVARAGGTEPFFLERSKCRYGSHNNDSIYPCARSRKLISGAEKRLKIVVTGIIT